MKREPEAAGAARLSDRRFSELAAFLHESCGIRLAPQKRLMVESRLMRRVRRTGALDFETYCRTLFDEQDPAELAAVIDLLTTHKTDFFRESHHFDFLADRIARPFKEKWSGCERELRVWSAGCSTGEEPYSIAMVLREILAPCSFRVLATDVSEGTLQRAARGLFDADDVAPIPASLRRQFVRKTTSGFEVDASIKSSVVFRHHNLMDDAYPDRPRHHVIFCRNTLVYFDRDIQRRVLSRMAKALVPRGFLFLGHSESMSGMGLPFETLGPTTFRKRGDE
jgi:chemotaxis protein methyltransferase CheR